MEDMTISRVLLLLAATVVTATSECNSWCYRSSLGQPCQCGVSKAHIVECDNDTQISVLYIGWCMTLLSSSSDLKFILQVAHMKTGQWLEYVHIYLLVTLAIESPTMYPQM